MRQFVRLDSELTAACPEVPALTKACVDKHGKPVFCNGQLEAALSAERQAREDVCTRIDLIRETETKAVESAKPKGN